MKIQLHSVRYNPQEDNYLWDTKTDEGEFDLENEEQFMSYMTIKQAMYEKYGKTVAFIETHQ